MPEKVSKIRLDVLLVERGLVSSRQRAQALIMAGKVFVGNRRMEKPGQAIRGDAELLIREDMPFVGRGGLKLAAALDAFHIDPSGLTVLDVGASTGGFTHCLLLRGAAHVIAVDVGYGQLDWTLRNDPRVTVMERTNFRFLDPKDLPRHADAAVADVSFISLRLLLPKLREILPPAAWLVPLVKPQFEVGRSEVGKGGIVRDPEKIRGAVDTVASSARECGFHVMGELESPVRGAQGNREVFLHLIRAQ